MGNDNINCLILKILEVKIDNKLTCHEHIGIICNRMYKGIGIGILNILRLLPEPTLKTMQGVPEKAERWIFSAFQLKKKIIF